ncbi:MAG: TonB-dependent receptor [Pseudohongiellaceae bacterium]
MPAHKPHSYCCISIALLLLSTISGQVLAQPTEGGGAVEEVVVIGRQEFLETAFTARRSGSSVDAAKLMNQVPGGAANNNGPLTGQIQYRGMFGPRVNVRVDGMLIHGGGPNWMAPPLHHIPAGLMEELVVEQGIASIATGGGIGGAATAYWKKPAYGNDNSWRFTGDTELSLESVDGGSSAAGVLGFSNRNHRIYAVGSFDKGDDYQSSRGDVAATRYRRDVYGLGYTAAFGMNEIAINLHRIETDETGTPSLPMDIDWFDTEVWNLGYQTRIGDVGLSFRVYGSEINHGMNNYMLRKAPDFSSLPLPPFVGDDKRNVRTTSDETGFRLTVDWSLGQGEALVGIEGKDATHEATVFDPDFAAFFVQNFNDSRVDSLSWFGQWSALFGNRWYVEAGVRVERMEMDTGAVDAFPARLVDMNGAMWPAGTPPRAVWLLRQTFNAADRSRRDNNRDWVAKGRYQLTDMLVVELAAARKTRSPLYQERYLWIPLEANAGLGDGNNYVGNPALEPEVSHQLELGLDFDYGDVYFSPRIYTRKVDDYIQGVAATNMAVIGVSRNANGDPTPLMFANTEAEFSGVDMSFGYIVNDSWRVDGIASYSKGDNSRLNDNIYRVAPASLRLAVEYNRGRFNGKLEQVLVGKQDDLSATGTRDVDNPNNSFVASGGYGLTNLFLNWYLEDGLTVSLGAENILDRHYVDHVTGFNRVLDSVVPQGSRMFGHGRNVFGRLQYQW